MSHVLIKAFLKKLALVACADQGIPQRSSSHLSSVLIKEFTIAALVAYVLIKAFLPERKSSLPLSHVLIKAFLKKLALVACADRGIPQRSSLPLLHVLIKEFTIAALLACTD